MNRTTPSYYRQFRCIASQCPDSCCKEWDVLVDDASAARYRTLPGPLGDRLRQVLLDTEDGTVMQIENGRCPMWRADGLCRIQAELGEAALCQVCSEFPRLTHDYGDFVEHQLELSCPAAARLILSDRENRLVTESVPGGCDADYDADLMNILLCSRAEALALLADPDRTPEQALTLLLMYGYHIQAQLDGDAESPFDPDAAFTEAVQFAQPGDIRCLLDFFAELEILTPEWAALLKKPAVQTQWSGELLAMARYLVLRYWLQASADFDLICRVKLIIASCLGVRVLGGDVFRTAQLYSKEIENSAENVDAILDAAYTHPAFTDAHLLHWLQSL